MAHHPSRHVPGAIGLLLAVLALVSQLSLGALVLPDQITETKAAQLDALTILCRNGVPARPDRSPAHRRAPAAALCPLAFALALPAVLPAAAIAVPARSTAALRHDWTPAAARAPPPPTSRAHYPRGPPVLA